MCVLAVASAIVAVEDDKSSEVSSDRADNTVVVGVGLVLVLLVEEDALAPPRMSFHRHRLRRKDETLARLGDCAIKALLECNNTNS